MQMQSGTISRPRLAPRTVTARCMQRQFVRVFSITFDTLRISSRTKEKGKAIGEEEEQDEQGHSVSLLQGCQQVCKVRETAQAQMKYIRYHIQYTNSCTIQRTTYNTQIEQKENKVVYLIKDLLHLFGIIIIIIISPAIIMLIIMMARTQTLGTHCAVQRGVYATI